MANNIKLRRKQKKPLTEQSPTVFTESQEIMVVNFTKDKAMKYLEDLFVLCTGYNNFENLRDAKTALDCVKFMCNLNGLTTATPTIFSNHTQILNMLKEKEKVEPQ